MFVYLDNSATTKPYAEVIAEMVNYMEVDFGNPSSLHRMGIISEKGIKKARKSVARCLGAREEEIFFTSCGTEADNMAVFGVALRKRRQGNKIITSKIEHPAVLECCKQLESSGFQVEYIEVNNKGMIDMTALEAAIDSKTILISVMQVNNEIGTSQPLNKINDLRRRYEKKLGTEILFHTDAVQSIGKMPININQLGVDLMSISGHKIHGPKGVGALYIKKGINIPPQIYGGGQERSLRSGTENVPGIVGFGKAADISHLGLQNRINTMWTTKKYLLEGIRKEIKDILINGQEEEGSPSILNISFLGVRGEVLLHALEQSGIFVSTGSACSSHKKGDSHVLRAIGLSPKEIEGSVRFSLNEFNTIKEMDYVLDNLKGAVSRLRKIGSFR